MHWYNAKKVALVNSTTHTLKINLGKETGQTESRFTTSGQETERVYSYNPGAHTISVLIPATPGDISVPATTAPITLITVSWS